MAANSFALVVPYKLASRANERLHWGAKAARTATERQLFRCALLAHLPRRTIETVYGPRKEPLRYTVADWSPVAVRFTRIAPGTLDDDNVAGAFKAIRDGIAQALGVEDRPPFFLASYWQRKARRHAVLIELLPPKALGLGRPSVPHRVNERELTWLKRLGRFCEKGCGPRAWTGARAAQSEARAWCGKPSCPGLEPSIEPQELAP